MKIQRIAGVVIFLAGVVWSIGFPKKSDLLAFDFVGSVAIGLGLLVGGVVVYTLERKRLAVTATAFTLFVSLLVNAYLMAEMRGWQRMSLEQREQAANKARHEAGLTHEQRVELLKVRESVERELNLHEQPK